MSRFSDINWAAFLLGGFWWPILNRFYGWAAGYWIAMIIVASVGSVSFGASGMAASLMLSQVTMIVFAVYLALYGNRMLVDRIDVADLSPEEKRGAKEWTYRSQRRQTIGGALFVLLSYVGPALFTFLVLGDIVLLGLLIIALAIHVAALAILLILAPRYSFGRNELLVDVDVGTAQETSDQTGVSRLSARSKIALAAIGILIFVGTPFAVYFIYEEANTIRQERFSEYGW
ncbi:MAG: hypothetical protein FWE48_02825 [Coriobacteriia bacterium]|nr:hypothetical protein [Coriobacteriia bacterium]